MVEQADKAVNESKERIRSAIINSGLVLPPKRITLNLAPADLPKGGTAYDLGIAIAILVASDQIENPDNAPFIGMLSLYGTIRKVAGVLSAVMLAKSGGFKRVFIPSLAAAEPALGGGAEVFPIDSLTQ